MSLQEGTDIDAFGKTDIWVRERKKEFLENIDMDGDKLASLDELEVCIKVSYFHIELMLNAGGPLSIAHFVLLRWRVYPRVIQISVGVLITCTYF